MKATFFSTDLVVDSNNNFRLLELNTDTSVPVDGVEYLKWDILIKYLQDNNIKNFHLIYKSMSIAVVNSLLSEVKSKLPNLNILKHVEEITSIYPINLEDSDDSFILRFAYDESAIFDSEYTKNNYNIIKLFRDSEDLDSVPEHYYVDDVDFFDNLPREINSLLVPDVVVKKINTTIGLPIGFYKLGNSNLSTEDRYTKFIDVLDTNGVFIQKYYESDDNNRVFSYRTFNILLGNLDLLEVGTYKVRSLLDKPTEIEYNDSNIINKIDLKHYFEFTTNYFRAGSTSNFGGVFEDENVINSDGISIPIKDIKVNDIVKSYYVAGAPDTEELTQVMDWFYPGMSLPEGSEEATSIVINNIESPLAYNLTARVDLGDYGQFRISPNNLFLVYDGVRDVLRYKPLFDITPDMDKVISGNETLVPIKDIFFDIMDGEYVLNLLDVEEVDNFYIEPKGGNGTPVNIKLIVRNCFVAGTKVVMADGSIKNIEDVLEGDDVLTWDEKSGENKPGRVNQVRIGEVAAIIDLVDENGVLTKTTPTHRYWTSNRGWVSAEKLTTDDILLSNYGKEIKIKSVTKKHETHTVYNLCNVTNCHTFYADGKVVHNTRFCFQIGTLVTMADGSKKSIENVKIGDYVLSKNEGTGKLENKRVINSHQPIHNDLVRYTFSNGKSIVCTADHPLYTIGYGLKSFNPKATNSKYDINHNVSKIEIGDVMIGESNQSVKLDRIDILDKNSTQTFMITVADNHNFFANGFLSHNK